MQKNLIFYIHILQCTDLYSLYTLYKTVDTNMNINIHTIQFTDLYFKFDSVKQQCTVRKHFSKMYQLT